MCPERRCTYAGPQRVVARQTVLHRLEEARRRDRPGDELDARPARTPRRQRRRQDPARSVPVAADVANPVIRFARTKLEDLGALVRYARPVVVAEQRVTRRRPRPRQSRWAGSASRRASRACRRNCPTASRSRSPREAARGTMPSASRRASTAAVRRGEDWGRRLPPKRIVAGGAPLANGRVRRRASRSTSSDTTAGKSVRPERRGLRPVGERLGADSCGCR